MIYKLYWLQQWITILLDSPISCRSGRMVNGLIYWIEYSVARIRIPTYWTICKFRFNFKGYFPYKSSWARIVNRYRNNVRQLLCSMSMCVQCSCSTSIPIHPNVRIVWIAAVKKIRNTCKMPRSYTMSFVSPLNTHTFGRFRIELEQVHYTYEYLDE